MATTADTPSQLSTPAIELEPLPLHTAADEPTITAAESQEDLMAANLPPVDGGKGAWLYLAGAIVTEINIFGSAYSQGTYLAYHTSNPSSPFHNSSASALSAIGSILVGGAFAAPYLFHGVLKANPHIILQVYFATMVTTFLSLLAASFLPAGSAGPLIFLQGVIPGVAGGIAFLPAQMWLSEWFVQRRGSAAALLYLGSGIGGIMFPLVFDALLKRFAFRWTLRWQAGIQTGLAGIALMIMRPRIPIRRPPPSSSADRRWKQYMPGSFAPLLCVPGVIGAVITVLQASAWTAISLYLSTLCISIGLSETAANGLLAAYNGSAVVSFMFAAILVDRLSTGVLMAISTTGCALATFLLLGFARSLDVVLPFILMFGVLGASFSTFVISMPRAVMLANSKATDFNQLSFIFILIRGLGATAGPLVASVLYDAGKATKNDLWGSHGMKNLVIFSGTVMGSVAAISISFRQQLKSV
ncbi:hypothetical protein OC846_002594 [Tilletia horrida]|uniref:Major facilitator superfamily (MFS) profile domain-containing protein n=1 Tax=Tilletia horrida TaxID=155126 RepID=A0AAN6GTC5_9BASI|nr:hypothetical protein OC845_002865 [Tilletia horrida]KAK0553222.1 hypothetical protein OC846_002594 [Tilletia horrida]KAK0565294.1 hypothetical protein OC861_003841 [Tilletia horrida]